MRTLFLKTIRTLIIVLLSACNFPEPGEPILVEPGGQGYESTECAFMWANEPLPELSDDFNQALKHISGAEGYVQAYGENCVTNEGEVVRFLAMETDFYITLQVDGVDDEQVLGELVEQATEVLAQFPTDKTPGPQPGYVGITFETPEDRINLWIRRTEIESALESGLRGKELLDSLQTR